LPSALDLDQICKCFRLGKKFGRPSAPELTVLGGIIQFGRGQVDQRPVG
jgi:hypothetical protein